MTCWLDISSVEVVVVGAESGEPAFALAQPVDAFERGLQHVADADRLAGLVEPRDLEDLALRLVEQVLRLEFVVVGAPRDVEAGLEQPPLDRLLAHDLGVVDDARRRHDGVGEVDQAVDTAGVLQPAAPRQLVADDERVGGLAAVVRREDRVEDDLVPRQVEVLRAQEGDVGDGVRMQQQRTEHGALCFQVLGNPSPIERLLEVDHGTAASSLATGRPRARCPPVQGV